MKILMVHNKYKQNGGEDTVFYNEMSLLKAKGHMVDKLIFENSRINNIFSKLKIGISGIYNIESANMLKDKIKKFKPDVIHVHNFFPIASPSIFWVAKKFKIPVVLTLHNYRLICPNAILFRNGNICEKCMDKIFPYSGIIHKCYRNSFMQTLSLSLVTNIHKYIKTWHSKVDKFITLTNFQKNKFLSSNMNISEEKFLVKSNFVDDFGNGYKNRENYFVYVGRLSIEKGIITMLKAFENTKYNLYVVGEGPLKNEVLKYTKKNKNIKYLGFKSKKEIINLLKKSISLIFPSEWYEGFPMVLVETLSTGTPIITSDIGSQAEIVKDNYLGLHFIAGDFIDLRSKITEFFEKKDKTFYQNARDEYLEKYTPEKNYKQLIDIYEKVINDF
ncbi:MULTISPECIES: glycosyltransferase family 4 protein [unclassified Lebetimonas]|uniref:glycosyltransferase family 4 protein n=1 Tax=unclassified Lebetimonas TaxID=2648158 RepID=UPI000466C0DF|nr:MULTISPECIES: glycosyltransferase family 4 protein [unclassified Lebetimonas]